MKDRTTLENETKTDVSLIVLFLFVLGLQECLEKYLGKKAPALILVPVVDLPGKEVIHITCWLS